MKTKPNPFHQPAMVRDPESGELKETLTPQKNETVGTSEKTFPENTGTSARPASSGGEKTSPK